VIEYFTALVITYFINDKPFEAHIWFENHRECQHVMQSDMADPVYDYLMTLYGRNIMMRCITTDEVSREAIRPKARPKNWTRQ
tara:strand:- start:1542 stop:1790 length:249 start_codon:yes stop_codon:yes gene_type:complete